MKPVIITLICVVLTATCWGAIKSPTNETNATDAGSTTESNGTKPLENEATENKTTLAKQPTWIDDLKRYGPIGLLITGGWFMLPILLLAILALAVIIERWRSLKMLNTNNELLREAVLDDLTKDHPE